MYIAKVSITLRRSILDPQGKAIRHGLESLGMKVIDGVRIGKHIEMTINSQKKEEAEQLIKEACVKLLANPVMEDFSFTVEKV